MADDFIGSLKADWDRAGREAEVARLRRRRRIPHGWLAGDLLGAVTMAVFGLIYAALAMKYRDLLLGLSAVAMLPIGLPLAITGVVMRQRGLAWDDETPEGVLKSSLRRLDATHRVLTFGQAAPAVLFALATLVVAAALLGWITEPTKIVAVIIMSWVLAALCSLTWIRWRLVRVAREIASCAALLRQFELSTPGETS